MPTGDVECERLMLAIESALTNGGWTQIGWQGGDILMTRPNRPAAGLVAATNIIIAVYPDQLSQLGAAAKALESALNGKGIATQLQDATGIINPNHNAIHILIGRKL